MDFIIIGTAGSLGAMTRYLVYLWEKSQSSHLFPYATLIINLSGCFLAGIIIGLADDLSPAHRQTLTLVSIGFVGSFTTFSTFGVETLNLIQSNQLIQAGLNIILNVCCGIGLIWLGKLLAS